MSYIGNSPATSTEVADNSVTLAKMAGGTDGNLITYDASGDPAYVTTGTSGQVLTSGGAGVAPTFQTAAGGGKLLQTVKIVEDSTEQALATATYTDTNLSVSITPTSATSKILCMWNIHAYFQFADRGVGTRLLRDSTNVFTTTTNFDLYVGSATDTNQRGSYMHLDSPSTTSSVTYKIQVSSSSGNAIELNASNNQSQLILMEIGA